MARRFPLGVLAASVRRSLVPMCQFGAFFPGYWTIVQ